GTDVVVFAVLHAGDVDEGRRAAEPVQRFGAPLAVALAPMPYAGFQAAFDPLLGPGERNYWKSHNFSTLSDAALDVAIAAARSVPTPQTEVILAQLGGAAGRVKATDTAFVARDTRYVMNVHGRWSDAADDARVRSWARDVFAQASPHASGSGY